MRPNTALITGVGGQDGSYLAEWLLDNGYTVVGTTRDPSLRFGPNIAHLEGRLRLVHCSYDVASIADVLRDVAPSEVYNLAGQTFVGKSWDMLVETISASAILPALVLDAIIRTDRNIRFFQASSCEIFSLSDAEKYSEASAVTPGNPYGCAKALAHNLVACYRKKYGLYATSGVLFHHESPRRHETFVSRKIVSRAVAIKLGRATELVLGDTAIARDWSYAPDIVRAIHGMMHLPAPEDLTLCSGEVHSLSEMVSTVFSLLDLDPADHVRTDPALFRGTEPARFGGDPARARSLLNWQPRRDFRAMLEAMVDYEMRLWTGKERNFANERPFS